MKTTVPPYELDHTPTQAQMQAELQASFGIGKLLDIDKWTVTNVSVPPPVTDTWYYWCKENEKVTVPNNTKCRYGVSATEKYNEKVMSGLITADNITFGDPAVGLAKFLYCNVAKPIVVDPPPSTGVIAVDAAAKGVKGDGVTDNIAALKRIAADYKGKSELIEIVLPAGQVNFSDGSWTAGLLRFHITCKTGIATLYKTGGNEWFVSHDTFLADGLFYPIGVGMGQAGLLPYARFKTAQKGAMSITLTNLVDASKYANGKRILLEGYETQGQGWPINPRFFEWKTIAGISNDVITFTQPLEHSYNDLWKDWKFPDRTESWGKPRIHLIDDAYPYYIKFSNIAIKPQLGFLNDANSRSAFHIGADTLECDNVDFGSSNVWPTINRIAKYNNVKNGGWEADKLVGYMEMTNSNTGGLWAATGCKQLVLRNTILKGFSPMTPHRATFDNVKFNTSASMATASVYAFRYWTGCLRWEFKNCQFAKGIPPVVADTINFTTGDISGNSFTLPDNTAWDSPVHQFAKLCYPGNRIKNSTGTIESVVNDVIYQNGMYVVQHTPVKGIITKGLAMSFRQVAEIVDSGNNKYSDGTPLIVK